MQDFSNKKIVLGVCGGIAAYKSVFLVRELVQLGADVRVVMTAAAQQFITPMTFQALSGHEVRCELFDEQAERAMGHIELARWADYLIIAPATANSLAKLAQGIADDLLSTLFLVADIPVFICPAMNRSMWNNAATQHNLKVLKERGLFIVGPEEGWQACGEVGFGRMVEVPALINAVRLESVKNSLSGQHVLITAGPTQEAIDPVRYLSNHSSGKMGYALAEAAVMAGACVTLISGPTTLPIPAQVSFISVKSAEDMLQAVQSNLQAGMIFIGCAAVSDYRVEQQALHKIKKQDQTHLTLSFTQNPDILSAVVSSQKAAYVVGFAAETEHVLDFARQKLVRKRLNMVVANQVGEGLGFASDENQVTVLTPEEQFEWPKMNKTRLAGELIKLIAKKAGI